ncbi:Phosphopantetheine attachment site [Oscillospiraceae bacterium]|nr:Phosphopantetheine attachment site [Oscillospiraceae bacterium]
MEEIRAILNELHDDVDYDTCTTLIDDRILDSFDIVTLVAEIDDKLDVRIPPEQMIPENFNSLKAIAALVERLENEI